MKNYGSVWLHKFVKILKCITFQAFPRLDSYFQDMTYSDDVKSEVRKGIYRLKLLVFCFGDTKDTAVKKSYFILIQLHLIDGFWQY
jgi:hypothetical protein